MKKYIYLRTSTDEQNPENQYSDVQSIAPHGCLIVKERQSAYKDDFKHRPYWNKIYSEIIEGKVSDLYCWDLDRLYRNRLKLKEFFEVCKARNTRIHSYRQKWLQNIHETPQPWGEIIHDMLVQIFGWMAEDESKRRSERVKAAIRRVDGITYGRKGGKWGRRPLPKQAKKKIIDLHNQGMSIRKIASQVRVWDNGNDRLVSRMGVHKTIADFKREEHRKNNPSLNDQ